MLNKKVSGEETTFAIPYSKGKIIIVSTDELDISNFNLAENDLLIIDKRDDTDPDIKIIDSYKINDEETMKEIISVLQTYEKNNPTLWQRSDESLFCEWKIHNILYYLNYKIDHTKDVDLNNADEETFSRVRKK